MQALTRLVQHGASAPGARAKDQQHGPAGLDQRQPPCWRLRSRAAAGQASAWHLTAPKINSKALAGQRMAPRGAGRSTAAAARKRKIKGNRNVKGKNRSSTRLWPGYCSNGMQGVEGWAWKGGRGFCGSTLVLAAPLARSGRSLTRVKCR